MALGLPYAVVEGILASMFEIPEAARAAFRARMKLMRRLGFPVDANTGRGRHVLYRADQLTLLALAFHFVSVVETTERSVELLKQHDSVVRGALRLARLPARDAYLILEPPSVGQGAARLTAGTGEDLAAAVSDTWRPVVSVNVHAVIRKIASQLFIWLEGAEMAYLRDLDRWIEEHRGVH